MAARMPASGVMTGRSGSLRPTHRCRFARTRRYLPAVELGSQIYQGTIDTELTDFSVAVVSQQGTGSGRPPRVRGSRPALSL